MQVMEENIKRGGRVLLSDLHRLTNIIERTGSCTASQAHVLIKSCGAMLVDLDRRRRTELLDRQFSLLRRISGDQLDVSHYNLLLNVSIQTSDLQTVMECLSFRFITRTNIQSMSQSFSPPWRLTASSPTE